MYMVSLVTNITLFCIHILHVKKIVYNLSQLKKKGFSVPKFFDLFELSLNIPLKRITVVLVIVYPPTNAVQGIYRNHFV